MFEFEYTLDKSIVKAGNKMVKKYAILINIAVPLLFISKDISQYFDTHDTFNLLKVFVFIVGYYLLLLLMNIISAIKVNKNNAKFLDQKIHIIFDDSKITINTKKEGNFEASKTFEWSMINKIKQDKSYYFLYVSKFKSYIFPKGSCTTNNESEFVSFMENKIKK